MPAANGWKRAAALRLTHREQLWRFRRGIRSVRLTYTTISIYLCSSWRVRPTIWDVKTLILLLALPLTAAAQSNAVYVSHNRVIEALGSGAVLLSGPDVKVAGEHRDTAGPLPTERATAILYVPGGAATLVTGDHAQRL